VLQIINLVVMRSMSRAFRTAFFCITFAAIFSGIFHAAHADSTHTAGQRHDCSLCQTLTSADVPVVAIPAPLFLISPVLPVDADVVVSADGFLPSNPRAPPL
jgi:hypothetical protein